MQAVPSGGALRRPILRQLFLRHLLACALLGSAACVLAQKPPPPPQPGTAVTRPVQAPARTPAKAPPKTPPPSAAPLPAGPGWRVAPAPAWVVEPPAADPAATPAPATGARRELLVDFQIHRALPKPQTYVRLRNVALDASALGSVSQPQIDFNPAYQTVAVHTLSVLRGGQRLDRIADARFEIMRREQRLEQQVIDGNETLLVVVPDVQVGEAVEVAYTVEGDNPIFEGRHAQLLSLGWSTPTDLVHQRVLLPAGRAVQWRSLAGDITPESLQHEGLQVLRVVRHQVSGTAPEPNVPPWAFPVPAWQFSDYADWREVDAWAERLFALPATTSAAVAEQAAALRATGATGAALVAAALRFVQDEVRYFSTSLGESSHRPKPPEQTLSERLGDCKDKVLLLNALLRELGFEPRPALVSMRHGRALAGMLAGHNVFDHVVTHLVLDGQVWYLDATIQGQGLTLAGRGHMAYGQALVVGSGSGPQAVVLPPQARNHAEYEQRWDLSRPGRDAQLQTRVRVEGLLAEHWRAALSAGGTERVADAYAGAYMRVYPGLQSSGPAELHDDREANTVELRQSFTVADFGQYSRGALEVEFGAIELMDHLIGPQEARRRHAFLLSQPAEAVSRLNVTTPRPLGLRPPPPQEVQDKHFRYAAQTTIDGSSLRMERRVQLRADEVLPADLAAFRDNVLRARQQAFSRARLSLFDAQAVSAAAQLTERRLRASRGWRNDALGEILARNEMGKLVATQVLPQVEPGSKLAALVLADRASAQNLLGQHEAALADAELALASQPDMADAGETRAVALTGLGRAEEALQQFQKLLQQERKADWLSWAGSLELLLGRPAEAETLLQEALERAQGEGREFTLLWLYLTAEARGAGQEAVAAQVDSVEADKLTGALLRYFTGRLTRDALVAQARAKPDMQRLNLAEAYYFIGRQLSSQGRAQEAQRWYRLTLEQQALPFREHMFAQLELNRAAAR